MSTTIELIPDPEQDGYTARLSDIPTCGEGGTEAIADPKEAFGLDDALACVNTPEVRQLDWNLAELTSG